MRRPGRGLLSIGELARASGLTIKALRLYDRDALLAPAWIDPKNQRRYYAREQVALARQIRALRDWGVPLKEIRRAFCAESDEERRAVLAAHRHRLQTTVEELERVIFTADMWRGPSVTIEERSCAPQPIGLYEARCTPDAVARETAVGFATLFGFLAGAGVVPEGPAIGLVNRARPPAGEVVLRLAVPIAATTLPAHPDVRCGRLAGGPVWAAEHRGSYAGLAHLQRVLARRDGAQDAAVATPREHYLVSPHDTRAPDEWVTRVEWPMDRPSS